MTQVEQRSGAVFFLFSFFQLTTLEGRNRFYKTEGQLQEKVLE